MTITRTITSPNRAMEPVTTPPKTCLKVLVVDDNVDGADSLAMLLRHSHHQVDVAYGGSTALLKAVIDPPDVILLDVGLPVRSGYEVAKRLRELSQTRESILIAMSGFEQESDPDRARMAGFDYQMVTPVDPAQIQELLLLLGELEKSRNSDLNAPLGIVELAKECLRNHSYGPGLKYVTCDYEDGVLILRGDVQTYYIKQVAQEAAARIEGVERVDNQIQVAPARRKR